MSASQAASLSAAPSAAADKVRPSMPEAAAPVAAKANPTTAQAKVDFDPKELSANLDKAIERLNEQMQHLGRDLSFSRDDQLGRTVVRVTSSKTGEEVRQIPNEALLRVAHSIEDLKGVLYDGQS